MPRDGRNTLPARLAEAGSDATLACDPGITRAPSQPRASLCGSTAPPVPLPFPSRPGRFPVGLRPRGRPSTSPQRRLCQHRPPAARPRCRLVLESSRAEGQDRSGSTAGTRTSAGARGQTPGLPSPTHPCRALHTTLPRPASAFPCCSEAGSGMALPKRFESWGVSGRSWNASGLRLTEQTAASLQASEHPHTKSQPPFTF